MGRSCRVPRHLLSCIESSRARMQWRSECWHLCASLGWGWDFFRRSRRGKLPFLHCPHHSSWAGVAFGWGTVPLCHLLLLAVPCQKSRCSDSAICGDFLCLPTGSPSSLLCIASATRENLSVTSSSVSRATLSTCKGLCLQTTGSACRTQVLPRCAESSCPHQPDLLPRLWKESRSPGSFCRLLEEQRFPSPAPDTALDTEPGTEVPADLFLSLKGSFNLIAAAV